ncbi:MAG: GNAT family N-acetyltransferase [Cyanobacteria bacterium P01_G01_bin.39]
MHYYNNSIASTKDQNENQLSSSQLCLKTPRLEIVLLRESDCSFVVSFLQSSGMVYLQGGLLTEQEAHLEFERMLLANTQNSLYCLVVERESKSPIGMVKLYEYLNRSNFYQIGYWTIAERKGRGFAPEAAQAMIAYAFEICKLNRVEAYCRHENLASMRVLFKIGMSLESNSFLFEGKRYYQFAAHNSAKAIAA